MHSEAQILRTASPRQSGAALAELGCYSGEARAFWPTYLESMAQVFDARRVLLLARMGDVPWQVHGQWPQDAVDQAGDAIRALTLADQAMLDSPAAQPADSTTDRPLVLAARVPEGALSAGQHAVVIMFMTAGRAPDPDLLSSLSEMAVAIPAYYAQLQRASRQRDSTPSQAGAERLFDVIQLAIDLGGETRFMRAALRFANALAFRFKCDRAALGWVDRRYVKLTAVSHVEKFDRRASASRDLEAAMEETLDQNIELNWPEGADARLVMRAHESYARMQGSGHLLSVPLRIDGVPVAVMSLERRATEFTAAEIWELRLLGEACARQLDQLRRSDRWLGARALARLVAWRDIVLGPSYTAWKLAGIGFVALISVLSLLPWPYRIEATVVLRSQDILFMPAPFDGYLRHAHIEVGDTVAAGELLVELDTRELVLEESMAASDASRYLREAEKAQAGRQLADMQIALAREQQALSKLQLVRHQLANAQLRAPFAGVVVEGELKKNIGAPVRKGDLLVKLAHTGQTYVELAIDQADIHELSVGARGEFAFVGRPDLRFPMVIERIDPAATMREGQNIYLARARFDAAFQSWWRPGMGGSARIEAGERSVIWILTHRTVRYLRQVFWI